MWLVFHLFIFGLAHATTPICISCTADLITFTPADPMQIGTIDSTFDGPAATGPSGCLQMNLICAGGTGYVTFMQFNVNQGGPIENSQMQQTTTATVDCVNGTWAYDARTVFEVNCLQAPNG